MERRERGTEGGKGGRERVEEKKRGREKVRSKEKEKVVGREGDVITYMKGLERE